MEVLQTHADLSPEKNALIFLGNGTDESESWTYSDIALHASRIAARLAEFGATGKRAVLLYEPGLEYVAALFGAWQAGAIAVPSFPPLGTRALQRLGCIIDDARPDIILSAGRMRKFESNIHRHCAAHHEFVWINTDELAMPTKPLQQASVTQASIALLQYTSGSTGQPKGVMISHGNLMSNSQALMDSMAPAEKRMGCSWLPPYHDMGLMGGILLPLYAGFPVALFSPTHFVQNPARWLRAISRYHVSVTVAPNFALDLCVDNIDDADIADIDLSSITELFCGAEPIRHSSVERFGQRFGRCGFKREAFNPCYGLAEATLFVSGKRRGTAPRHMTFEKDALDRNQVVETVAANPSSRTLIGCGAVAEGHVVRIVEPDTCTPCCAGQVGEIWVSGPNVAGGYWNRKEESVAAFEAFPTDSDCAFLRTGDLGFVLDGELFVTGRIKDVIIIAGRNHYPQDIELTAQNAHPELRANGVAAFRIDTEQGEALVIVAEVRRRGKGRTADIEAVRDAIIRETAAAHGVRPHAVHIGPVGTLPLTTSGKVQRRKCRMDYLAGRLPVLDDAPLAQEA